MVIYYSIIFFILGTILGSFYNVVGSRLPIGESIIYPRSHCDNCKHILSPIELIPIFSYLFQKGKCKKCGLKISIIHPIYELLVGLLFMLSYLSFGISYELIIVLSFISILSITIVSDYNYMIISDEVLVFGLIILFSEILVINGGYAVLVAFCNLVISLMIMYFIKLLGNLLFKKESMGDGDIKLIGFIGIVLGWENVIFTIFLGSIIALPISIINLKRNNSHILPFGPFLDFAAIIILLIKFDFMNILKLLGI